VVEMQRISTARRCLKKISVENAFDIGAILNLHFAVELKTLA